MIWTTIKSEEEYIVACQRMIEIFECSENTPESKELEQLILLITDYEDKSPTFAF